MVVVKAVDEATAVVGDILHYHVTLTNDGSEVLTSLRLRDALAPDCDRDFELGDTLMPGASQVVDCMYVTTPADVGALTNIAQGNTSQTASVASNPATTQVHAAAPSLDALVAGRHWGSSGSANGQFSHPRGIGVASGGGLVYVADSANHRIQEFEADGTFVRQWTMSFAPHDVAVEPNEGDVYVTDPTGNRVVVYDPDGVHRRDIAMPSGQVPHGIAVDLQRRLYVVGPGLAMVAVFDEDDHDIGRWSGPAGTAPEQFESVAVGGEQVYVLDAGNHRVLVFSEGGAMLSVWGNEGTADGQFQSPTDLTATQDGAFVADAGQDRIQWFDRSGRFLVAWATGAAPQGIAASSDGAGSLYVTDDAAARVDEFARRAPAVSVAKVADQDHVAVGEAIDYHLTVTNTGNVPVEGIALTDPKAPACDGALGTLAVGAHTTVDCQYVPDAGDVGLFTNTAQVTSTNADPRQSNETTTLVTGTGPIVGITKTAAEASVAPGASIHYRLHVMNLGSVPLTGVVVTDPNAPGCTGPVADLASGQTVTVDCTYTTTFAEVGTSRANTASVDTDQTGPSASNTVQTSIDADPPLVVVLARDEDSVLAGEVIHYHLYVVNTGSEALGDVSVDWVGGAPDCEGPMSAIPPGEHVVRACTYLTSASDVGSHAVRAQVSAGEAGSRESNEVVTEVLPVPAGRPDGRIKLGATGTYKGDDIYNTTGVGQTRRGSAARGHSVTYYVSVQNEAPIPDHVRLRGTGSNSRFTVQYSVHGTPITNAVTSGSYTSPALDPNAALVVKVVVTVRASAPAGSSLTATMTAKSDTTPAVRDTVRFVTSRG